ncbi:MAG: iron ABC transporter permease [Actinobacteria bacterium]|nr:iron ABC transporter permease [Actinomycetota bacterium]
MSLAGRSDGLADGAGDDCGSGARSGHARRGAIVGSAVFLAGVVALAIAGLLSLRIGSVSLTTGEVLGAFTDFDGSNAHLIVRSLRLPRTVIGIGVGAALAAAGVVMQAITRNALASPSVLGINSGAAFGVVTAVFVLGVSSPSVYLWFAFAGALGAAALVYLVGSVGASGPTPVKLVLAGAVVTALLSAWISTVLIFDQRSLDEVRSWLAGSLAGRDLATFGHVAPFLAVGLVVAFALARSLNTISLGEDVAANLGQNVAVVRGASTVVVVLLAGAAVAAAGPVGFVGLAVPHAVRTVVGPDHRWLLPVSVVGGPVLVLGADVLGRVVARPSEVQVGIVTAIIGAPVLIHLVRGRQLSPL